MTRVGLTGGLGSGKSAVALVFAEGGAHVFSADELGRALMQPGQAVYRQIVAHFGSRIVKPDAQLDRRALAAQAFEHGRLLELNAIIHPAVLAAQDEQMRRVAAEDPDGIAVIESALIFEVVRDAKAGTHAEVSRSAGPGAIRGAIPGAGPSAAPGAKPGAKPGALPSSGYPPDGNLAASRLPAHQRAPDARAASEHRRFDRLVLVTAPEELKVSRYIGRIAPPNASESTREALAHDARARLAAQIPDAEKIPFCDFVIENTGTLVLLRRKAQAVLAALRAKPQDQPNSSPLFF